jgi:shikimate kinase
VADGVRQLVLIGPVCAGKSTLLPVLSRLLDRRAVDLDDVAEPYYEEVGRGREALHEIGAARGDLGAYLWWQEGHPHAVRRVLADHPTAIVALGAGHSCYEDEALFDEVRVLLEPCAVALVLPSADLDESVAVLRARSLAEREMDWVMDSVDLIDRWVRGAQNHSLADVTVFTDGRTPEEVAIEIVRYLGEPVRPGAGRGEPAP